jgi:hypothetical protein
MKDMRTVPGNSGKEIAEEPSGFSLYADEPFEVQDDHERDHHPGTRKTRGFDDKQTWFYHQPRSRCLVSFGI